MYKLSVADQHQLGSELLAKFLQLRHWDGWNDSNTDIFNSQEMMLLINETILGPSGTTSLFQPTDTTAFAVNTAIHDGSMLYDPMFNATGQEALPFGGDYFRAFHKAYFSVHGYLAIVISIFGIVSNVINIAVLSQKAMVTPTNAILTALAVVDVLVMLTYVPFALHQYILRSSITITQWRSLSWMVFICFNINFTIVCHTISVWLTITLAVFRYIAVTFPAKVQDYCSMRRAIMAIVMAFLCTAIMCTPSYMSVQVSVVTDQELIDQMDWTDRNTTMYYIDESDLSRENGNIPRIISFYAFSVLAKLVPCVVLTWLSIQLVRALIQAERRRFQLKNPNGVPARRTPPANSSTTSTSNGAGAKRGSLATAAATETTHFLAPPTMATVKHHSNNSSSTTTPAAAANNANNQRPPQRDRTTRMLLAILVFFLITEFPSGLVALFSCFSTDFFTYVYGPLGDLMDILALVNSSVNFILYCSMSRQFRKTFTHMFMPKVITERWKRWKTRRNAAIIGHYNTNNSNSSVPIAMSERTITYFPVQGTKTEDLDTN